MAGEGLDQDDLVKLIPETNDCDNDPNERVVWTNWIHNKCHSRRTWIREKIGFSTNLPEYGHGFKEALINT